MKTDGGNDVYVYDREATTIVLNNKFNPIMK